MKNKFLISAIVSVVVLMGIVVLLQNSKNQPEYTLDREISEVHIDENVEVADDSVETEDLQQPVSTEITVTAVGDIMFHMPQVQAARTEHGYNFYPCFSNIKYINDRADLSLANLETVTGGSILGYQGFPRFNSPDSVITALEATGFDVLCTANNHSLDQGKQGIINTIDNIKNHGMDNIGTYIQEKEYLIKDVKGIKVGLLAYTYGLNGMDYLLEDEERYRMIDLLDEDLLQRDIQSIKEQSDIVLVYVHWGVEYQRTPTVEQVDLGDKIISWGADAVLGSHPHVLQPAELRDDGYIIYSMGNFISNQRWEYLGTPYTEDGVVVELNIVKKGDTTSIESVNYIPTWVYRYYDQGWNYTVLPIEDGKIPTDWEHIPIEIKNRMEKSYQDTMDILSSTR